MTFCSIREALQYAVENLCHQKHSFIIDIAGPAEVATGCACILQIVDEDRVFQNESFGLALYLAFDKSIGEFGPLTRFKQLAQSKLFSDVSYDPEIECFAIAFGTDVPTALWMTSLISVGVYEYTIDDEFQATVYDETPS